MDVGEEVFLGLVLAAVYEQNKKAKGKYDVGRMESTEEKKDQNIDCAMYLQYECY